MSDNVRDYIKIDIKKRQAQPYEELSGRSSNLESEVSENSIHLARHHIIPYNTIRDFYNKTVEREDIGKEESFSYSLLEKINAYINLKEYKVELTEEEKELSPEQQAEILALKLASIKEKESEQIKNYINVVFSGQIKNAENEDSFGGYDNFNQFYTWLSCNIFVGPKNRSDDPGGKFEENSKYIIENDGVFKLMKDINKKMEKYNKEVDDFNESSDTPKNKEPKNKAPKNKAIKNNAPKNNAPKNNAIKNEALKNKAIKSEALKEIATLKNKALKNKVLIKDAINIFKYFSSLVRKRKRLYDLDPSQWKLVKNDTYEIKRPMGNYKKSNGDINKRKTVYQNKSNRKAWQRLDRSNRDVSAGAVQ